MLAAILDVDYILNFVSAQCRATLSSAGIWSQLFLLVTRVETNTVDAIQIQINFLSSHCKI